MTTDKSLARAVYNNILETTGAPPARRSYPAPAVIVAYIGALCLFFSLVLAFVL